MLDTLAQLFDPGLFWEYRTILLAGAGVTLYVFALAAVVAVVLGLTACLLRLSGWRALRWIGTFYAELCRNTPEYVLLIWIHYVPPLVLTWLTGVKINFAPAVSAVIALGLASSGYFTETFRAGILAVPRGHVEAARSLAMSSALTLRRIVLPQAVRRMLPDVFVSSLFYTIPRALVVNYVAPMWHKGHLAICHKDNASRFKSAADFNKPDVTFSVNVGTREEHVLKMLFPKAKIITTSGQIALSAEPVRTKKADLVVMGDLDVMAFAAKNSWAHVVDEEHPFGRGANTWAIRHGDPAWKFFLDMWADNMVESGFMQERFNYYKELLVGA